MTTDNRVVSTWRSLSLELTLITTIFIADRVSKHLANTLLPRGVRVPFIPGVLSFFYTENSGAAFGILPGQRWLLSVVSSLILVLMIKKRALLTEESTFLRVTWSLIFAGALGNLWDRLLSGVVVDFLHLDFVRFAIFNVADVAITSGASLYIAALLWFMRKPDQVSENGKP